MIHLIVGNTGSGKSTYANRLKQETDGVVFTLDQWNKTLFLPDKKEGDGLSWFLERIERAEAVMLDLIPQLENAGVDAILDLGFSKKEHREKFRRFASAHQMELKVHFLDVPKEVRRERILKRNRKKGNTFAFEVTEEDFLFMESWFEKPTEEELENGIIVKGGS